MVIMERQRQAETSRRYGWIFAVAPVALFFAVIGTIIGVRQHANNVDGQFRDRAVAAYMTGMARRTHGGIQIDKSAGVPAYNWEGSGRTLTIPIKLGSCSGTEGYFRLKDKRPMTPSDIGDLFVELPGGTGVSTDSRNLNQKLLATALAACVKTTPVVPPDGA